MPLGSRVLVQEYEDKANPDQKIFIPEVAKTPSSKATVIALGMKKKSDPNPFGCNVGDVVLVSKYAGHEIQIGTDKYKVLDADDILGRFLCS